MYNIKYFLIGALLGVASFLASCAKTNTSFSTLPSANTFKQSTSIFSNNLDILWVIDNSGSMQPYQQNLVNNFNSFITQFSSKGYDFKIAVTGSDAFLADPSLNGYNSYYQPYAKFRDGYSSHSGVFVITPATPNLSSVFVTNATLGANGTGDERAFSSLRTSLNSSQNAGFLRPNSFLAVIVLSDEDDFSGNGRCHGCGSDHNYSASTLDSTTSYVTYLDQLTNTSGSTRRYNVSNISVIDSVCQAAHASGGSVMGTRYMQLTQATAGVSASICDTSYANALNQIQTQIAELSTQFFLDKLPILETISVKVNGVVVALSATNGWTYNSESNSIVFHGAAIPPQNATIVVDFIPQNWTSN